ncbi:MAG: 16S rRNA (guanine(966)-N(2))-methyltransferase RsmD [Clostridia bacterium]
MRIISGKYRGRRLFSPPNNDVRPTSDVVKESLFDTLQFDLEGEVFVDLFSGTGNIGIEALSRGAEVIFVDSNRRSAALIAQNLEVVGADNQVLTRDFRDALNSLGKKVKYIYVDPPYATEYINEICDIVAKRDLLEDGGYIIYEHDRSARYELSNKFMVAKAKKFGTIRIEYIAKVKTICAVTGSFDPITNGHLNVIMQAKKQFDKVVILIANNPEKKYMFDMQTRKELVCDVVRDIANINVDTCDGYVFEYCNANEISVIMRGYRNEVDYAYEAEMAKFNYENGNINTLLTQSNEDVNEVSSSQVRQKLQNGESIKGLVPSCIARKIADRGEKE